MCSASSAHLTNVSNDVHWSERDMGKLAREGHKIVEFYAVPIMVVPNVIMSACSVCNIDTVV